MACEAQEGGNPIDKETISQKQGIVLLITFLLGSTLVLGTGSEAKQDSWLAILLAMVLSVPLFFIYARLLALYPGKDLFLIMEAIFGRVIGRLVILCYVWYAFHLGALVMRNFIEFIVIVSLPETPKYAVGIMMALVCIWGVKSGIEVLGRWTSFILPVILLAILVVTLLTIPRIKLENLKPVLANGMQPVVKGTLSAFSFPFAESVLLISFLGHLNKKGNPYKAYFISLLVSGLIIMALSVRSIAVLGVPTVSVLYFASYATVSLVNIGNFLQRIEVTVSIVFMFAGFIKICVCLQAACRGLTGILNIRDWKSMVAPLGLLMFIFSFTVYDNTMEMFHWAQKVYPYYALPFQVVIPLVAWIIAEGKKRFQ